MEKVLKTPYQQEREAFEATVYREWQELTSDPANQREAVTAHLMKKYHIHTRTRVWAIRKRVEARMAAEQARMLAPRTLAGQTGKSAN